MAAEIIQVPMGKMETKYMKINVLKNNSGGNVYFDYKTSELSAELSHDYELIGDEWTLVAEANLLIRGDALYLSSNYYHAAPGIALYREHWKTPRGGEGYNKGECGFDMEGTIVTADHGWRKWVGAAPIFGKGRGFMEHFFLVDQPLWSMLASEYQLKSQNDVYASWACRQASDFAAWLKTEQPAIDHECIQALPMR